MKKISAYILSIILLTSLISALDLSDYPSMFISNDNFNGIIVIGNKAPAEDVVTYADIALGISQYGKSGTKREVSSAILASEVGNIKDNNAIIIGNLCTNDKLKDFVAGSCINGKDSRFNEDESTIELFSNNGKYQIIISGFDEKATRKAGQILSGGDYLQGKNVKIVGENVLINVTLSSYPNIFARENNVDVVAVVGKEGSSEDVIAMTNILAALSKKSTEVLTGKNKLDTEIANPLNENIISIGNPCNNKVSHALLGNSNDCKTYTEPGKAYLKLLKNKGKYQLIVAAYSDEGIKKIADVLVNYEKYDLNTDYYEVSYDVSTQEKNKEIVEEIVENDGSTEVKEVVEIVKHGEESIKEDVAKEKKENEDEKEGSEDSEKDIWDKMWIIFKKILGFR